MFKRAPGYFDVTTYTGTGGAHDTAPLTVNHNLGVAPELIIVKDRDRTKDWKVWTTSIGDTQLGNLNGTPNAAWASDFEIKDVTATNFKVGTDGAFTSTNHNGDDFVAYLFATRPGVSKVGTYQGNNGTTTIDIDCGFTNGARFVLIKDTTYTGDWYVWDSVRGIVSGTDPILKINTTDTELLSSDWIDPLSSGFQVSTAGTTVNSLNHTYLFLAIA